MATAVVTGASRGLGRELCRQLAALGFDVVLTARDPGDARRVARILGVGHARLDVTDPESITELAATLAERGCDVLVNNAGITLRGLTAESARATMAVNLHGALAVTRGLVPVLRRPSRVVMVSSGLGELAAFSPPIRAAFTNATSLAEVVDLADRFVDAVANGTVAAEGWPASAYRVSKVALNAATRLLAQGLEHDGVVVNAVCPGWVATDMGGPGADRTVEVGARGITTVAADTSGATGRFYRDGAVIPW